MHCFDTIQVEELAMSDSSATSEKRKHKRYVVQDIEVHHAKDGKLLGRVINMSLGGMLILHETDLEVNKILPVRILLKHSKNSQADIETEVKVRWFHRNHSSGLIGFGLEFTDDSQEKLDAIQGIIDEFAQA